LAKVVLIYPRETDPPVEVTSFKSRMARYGVIAVASHLKAKGHDVTVFDELSGGRVRLAPVAAADYVCFSFLSFCARRAYAMADRFRRDLGSTVILGGSHVSVMPEEAVDHCAYVVRNEGEHTAAELIEALQAGGDPAGVRGISYRESGGRIVHTPDRPFTDAIDICLDLDLLPEYRSMGPLWNLRDAFQNGMFRVPMPAVQASRGCPAGCTFCVVRYQLGTRYRKRGIASVLEEVDAYLGRIRTPYLLFTDNDLSCDPDFSTELFTQIHRRHGRHLRPYIFARTDLARHPRLIEALSRFEHTTVGIGFESLDDEVLRAISKGQSHSDIVGAIEVLRRSPLHIHGLFMFGAEQDGPDVVDHAVDMALRHGFFNVGLCAHYDFPTRAKVLHQPQIIEDHRFIHRDWRFFSGNFVVHFPRQMRPSHLQRAILDGHERFNRRTSSGMYGYLPTRPTIERYIEYLRGVEAPYYDGSTRLDDRLASRRVEDLATDTGVRIGRADLYRESARFFARNLFRRTSWKLLLGMFANLRRGA